MQEATSKTLFDAERPLVLKVRVGETVKTIKVRFPTDEEWLDRQRRRKVTVKHLGRNKTETDVNTGELLDAALFAKLRTDEDGPEIDPFEAVRIIEQLGTTEVDDVVPQGGAYRVEMRVLGGTTAHLLAMPSAKDVFEYRRGFARVVDLPYNRQQVTINLEAARILYKKLKQSIEGYASESVPIIHQVAAVKAAVDALDASFQEDEEENFQ